MNRTETVKALYKDLCDTLKSREDKLAEKIAGYKAELDAIPGERSAEMARRDQAIREDNTAAFNKAKKALENIASNEERLKSAIEMCSVAPWTDDELFTLWAGVVEKYNEIASPVLAEYLRGKHELFTTLTELCKLQNILMKCRGECGNRLARRGGVNSMNGYVKVPAAGQGFKIFADEVNGDNLYIDELMHFAFNECCASIFDEQ